MNVSRTSRWTLSFAGALVAASVLLLGSARADVSVINQTNTTLVVAAGWHVNGMIVYSGWRTILNGGTEKVYQGSEDKILLCVMRQTLVNGQRVWQIPSSNSGKLDMKVSDDAFKCEQQGGPLNTWKFTDMMTGQVFVKDVNNAWAAEANLFSIPFFFVPNNLNQLFDP